MSTRRPMLPRLSLVAQLCFMSEVATQTLQEAIAHCHSKGGTTAGQHGDKAGIICTDSSHIGGHACICANHPACASVGRDPCESGYWQIVYGDGGLPLVFNQELGTGKAGIVYGMLTPCDIAPDGVGSYAVCETWKLDECTLPSASATRYVTSSCDTTSSAIAAEHCTLSCAPGYASVGNPTVTCNSTGVFHINNQCETEAASSVSSTEWIVYPNKVLRYIEIHRLRFYEDDACTQQLPHDNPANWISSPSPSRPASQAFSDDAEDKMHKWTSKVEIGQPVGSIFLGLKFDSPKAVNCVGLWATDAGDPFPLTVAAKVGGEWVDVVSGSVTGRYPVAGNTDTQMPKHSFSSFDLTHTFTETTAASTTTTVSSTSTPFTETTTASTTTTVSSTSTGGTSSTSSTSSYTSSVTSATLTTTSTTLFGIGVRVVVSKQLGGERVGEIIGTIQTQRGKLFQIRYADGEDPLTEWRFIAELKAVSTTTTTSTTATSTTTLSTTSTISTTTTASTTTASTTATTATASTATKTTTASTITTTSTTSATTTTSTTTTSNTTTTTTTTTSTTTTSTATMTTTGTTATMTATSATATITTKSDTTTSTTLWGWEAWFTVVISDGRYRSGRVIDIQEWQEEAMFLLKFTDGLTPPFQYYNKKDLLEVFYEEQRNMGCFEAGGAGQTGWLRDAPQCRAGQSLEEVRATVEEFCSSQPLCAGYSISSLWWEEQECAHICSEQRPGFPTSSMTMYTKTTLATTTTTATTALAAPAAYAAMTFVGAAHMRKTLHAVFLISAAAFFVASF